MEGTRVALEDLFRTGSSHIRRIKKDAASNKLVKRAIDEVMMALATRYSEDIGVEIDCMFIELKCDYIQDKMNSVVKEDIEELQYFIEKVNDILFVRLFVRFCYNKHRNQCAKCKGTACTVICSKCKLAVYCDKTCKTGHQWAHTQDCLKLTSLGEELQHDFVYSLIESMGFYKV